MKLAHAIEGGVAGVSTLTLLQEALHKIDAKTPRPFSHNSDLIKKIKKSSGKPHQKNKLFITIAGELLANAAYFGLAGLGKKKNAILTGSLLGAAAGLGAAFLTEDEEKNAGTNGHSFDANADLKKKLLTVALYTAGGLLSGVAIKRINKKTLKKLKKVTKRKK